tara:strand:- start:159 stop:1484 length:1326 start_codon:yes stop_codon:yes gene_type:complete
MKKILLVFMLTVISIDSYSQKNYIPSEDNMKSREWFKKARFGLFIHWGVYSVLGDGEWVMNNQNISISEYEKLPSFFNPIDFNPEDWVLMAKNAGMKYITVTTRHHDGFSMFNSNASDYNIVKKSPYGKDVIKMLSDACRKHGIKIFFYYSQLDWYRDDYFPRGRTGNGISGREVGNWDDYINFMKKQLTELLTNYGEIGGIWFDGEWDQFEWDGKRFGKKMADFKLDEIYALIHKLQPQVLIGSNHHLAPNPGEDFQMFEKDLPGGRTKSYATSEENIGNLPLEVCETINGSWGFNLQDRKHKSLKTLIHYLVKAAGYDSNFLLNVGPMPNGKIQKEHIHSLNEIGKWIKLNGDTIYGTTGGEITPSNEIAITKKKNIEFIHLLGNKLKYVITGYNPVIKSLKYYHSKKKVKYKLKNNNLIIDVDSDELNEIDTILILEG